MLNMTFFFHVDCHKYEIEYMTTKNVTNVEKSLSLKDKL